MEGNKKDWSNRMWCLEGGDLGTKKEKLRREQYKGRGELGWNNKTEKNINEKEGDQKLWQRMDNLGSERGSVDANREWMGKRETATRVFRCLYGCVNFRKRIVMKHTQEKITSSTFLWIVCFDLGCRASLSQ